MSTAWHAHIERRDFGDILSPGGLSRIALRPIGRLDALLAESPANDAVIAVWARDPRGNARLPELLICGNDAQADWAAWITTFAAGMRPFSAHMRLVPVCDLRTLLEAPRYPEFDRVAWPIAGLVLGEVLAAYRLQDDALQTISAAACASTLSFAMFRTAILGGNLDTFRELQKAWEFVRSTSSQRPRRLDSERVARVCMTVIRSLGMTHSSDQPEANSDILLSACREFVQTGGRVPLALGTFPGFDTAREAMRGTREDRVVACEKFLGGAAADSGTDADLLAFASGYLASLIAPGTMCHAGVLEPVLHTSATALLWYGFCAGWTGVGPRTVGSDIGETAPDLPASARRIIRDLGRDDPLLGAPICDIAFSEFAALARGGGNPLDHIVRMSQGASIVELRPGVCMTVNVSPRLIEGEASRSDRERRAIAEIGRRIERLKAAYSELVADTKGPQDIEQPSLFSRRRRKR